jgi:hypothetical protein
MKFKRVLVSGAFLIALLGGVWLGLRALAYLQPEAPVTTLAVGNGASPNIKTIDGTLEAFSADLPSTWSIDPESFSSGVISFAVTPATLLITNGVQYQIGVWMRVELEELPSGPLARRIELQPSPPSIVIEGQLALVDSAEPGRWVIESYPFVVDSATRKVTNGIEAEPGVWARVEMVKLAPGAPGLARRYATALELLRTAGEGGPTDELLDRVRQIDGSAGLWTVGNTQVLIGRKTVVSDNIAVDDLVLVRGQRSSEGIEADTIAALPPGEEVFFDGVIKGMTGVKWQVEVRSDNRVSVDVAHSSIQGPVALERTVRVHGIEVAPGMVEALHVWAVTDSPFETITAWLQSVEIEGPSALWRVRTFPGPVAEPAFVTLGADVWVDDTQGQVEPGVWLELYAAQQGDSMYRAERVKVLPRAPKRVIQGVIDTMPDADLPAEWRVDEYRVLVTADTAIVGSPRVGSFVAVSGVLDSEGALRSELITTAVQ